MYTNVDQINIKMDRVIDLLSHMAHGGCNRKPMSREATEEIKKAIELMPDQKAIELMPDQSVVTVTWDEANQCIDFHEPVSTGYYVPLWEVSSHASALHWVRHLSAKTWCTAGTISQFLDMIQEKAGIKIYGSS